MTTVQQMIESAQIAAEITIILGKAMVAEAKSREAWRKYSKLKAVDPTAGGQLYDLALVRDREDTKSKKLRGLAKRLKKDLKKSYKKEANERMRKLADAAHKEAKDSVYSKVNPYKEGTRCQVTIVADGRSFTRYLHLDQTGLWRGKPLTVNHAGLVNYPNPLPTGIKVAKVVKIEAVKKIVPERSHQEIAQASNQL